MLFIGKKSEEIVQEIERKDLHVFSYLEDEQWIWDNANLTAEGFINYFLFEQKNSHCIINNLSLQGMEESVKDLAFALHHLGAKVIISVRSENQLFEAKSYGYQIEAFENLIQKQKEQKVYLINTIPFKWLENTNALRLNKVIRSGF